jgi:phosphotransferase family enzyme
MLTPEEDDLVSRDPAIPGLRTVLDPLAFIEALGRAVPERDLRVAQIQYVKYKPGTFCRVAYSVDVAGESCELEARACRPEDLLSRRRKKEALDASVPGLLGSGALELDESSVLVTVFPNDSSLPQVPLLADASRRLELVRNLLPDRPGFWEGEMRCLRYWPGRRYSAELRSADGTRALLKAYTRRGYQRALHNSEQFRSVSRLRVARRLGCSDSDRLIAFEWLPGRMLCERLLDPVIDRAALAATGAALAELHAQPAGGLERWTREDEILYVGALALEIGFLHPRFAERAESVARRISAWLVDAAPVERVLHSDFSDTQVLIDGNDVAIVDLDSARCGDPADDLGALFAQIEGYVLREKVTRERAAASREAILDGYRRGPDPSAADRTAPYLAAGLLRRARFAFRSRRPGWQNITDSSLSRAEAVLDGQRGMDPA